MVKEDIDIILNEYPMIKTQIERLAQNYTLEDFILDNNNKIAMNNSDFQYSIYNIRERYTYDNSDMVRFRLGRLYVDFLHNEVLFENNIDKIFYIVAYHYLTLCQHFGYTLTLSDNVIFASQKNYLQYLQIKEYLSYPLSNLIPTINKEDCEFYEKCFRIDKHHYATKYFSLLDELIGAPKIIDKWRFDYEFQKLLNLFVFEYRIRIE